MRRRLKRVSFSYLLMFLSVLALSLTLSAKKVGASPIWLGNTKDAMDLQELYAAYKRIVHLDSLECEDIHYDGKRLTKDDIQIIKSRHKSYVTRRINGLLDSLESKDIYESGRRLTKDNVWIVGDGVPVFVKPKHNPRVLSLKEAEKHKFVAVNVVRDVYDATNKYVLIPKGSEITGPTELRIVDGQIRLTITGNLIKAPGFFRSFGGPPEYLIEPRVTQRIKPFTVAADPEEWYGVILKNPPLSATLLSLESDDIEEVDASRMRLSRDSEGQLHMLLPDTIEFIVRRHLFFSYPWDNDIYYR